MSLYSLGNLCNYRNCCCPEECYESYKCFCYECGHGHVPCPYHKRPYICDHQHYNMNCFPKPKCCCKKPICKKFICCCYELPRKPKPVKKCCYKCCKNKCCCKCCCKC